MASTESSSDPNGWVKSPPRVFVKIHSVSSKASLNGQYGLILQYVADKQRYTVLLCQSSQQEIVSLKVENLTRCTSWLEQTRATWQMMRHHPDAQRAYRQGMATISRLGGGTKPEYVLALLGVFLAVLGYTVGFTKLLTLLSLALLVGTVVAPDVLAHEKDWRTVVRNAPSRYRTLIRTQVPYVGPWIAQRTSTLIVFTLLLAVFFGYSLFATPSATTTASTHRRLFSSPFGGGDRARSSALMTDEAQQLHYYRLGFDDATQQLDFGTALAAAKLEEVPLHPIRVDRAAEDDYAWSDAPLPPRTTKSPLSLSTGLALFTVYRIVAPLVPPTLDVAAFLANLRQMDPWRGAALAFALYRIGAAFL